MESKLKEIKETSKDTTRLTESFSNNLFFLGRKLEPPEKQVRIQNIHILEIPYAIDSGP